MAMHGAKRVARLLVLGLSLAGCGSEDSGSSSGSTGGGSGSSGAAGSGGGSSGTSGNAGSGGGSSGTSGSAGSGGGSSGSSGNGGTSGTGGDGGSGGTAGTGGGGTPTDEPFSFFVTSLAALQALSGNELGFGGDLSYGETGPGAGLRGADKICAAVAERSMPGNGKTWRAFLSATAGEDGQPVNAIDRIGEGPWYDRIGRIVAMNRDALLNDRPEGAHPDIIDDLPNEDGVPNHQPDPNEDEVDNHDTLTGSDEDGELATDDMGDTCNDWTSAVGETGVPTIGHSWPRSNNSGVNWISDHDAGGCAPGVNLFGQGGPQPGDRSVGAGGGYGGFYCFALTP